MTPNIYYKDGILATYASIHGVNHPVIFLPSPLRKTVLSLAHTFSGHFRKTTTKSYINKVFTWPGISADVKQFVESCVECQKNTKSHPLRHLCVNLKLFLNALSVLL